MTPSDASSGGWFGRRRASKARRRWRDSGAAAAIIVSVRERGRARESVNERERGGSGRAGLVADRMLPRRRMAATRWSRPANAPRRHWRYRRVRGRGEGERGRRPSRLRPMGQKRGGGPLTPLPLFSFF